MSASERPAGFAEEARATCQLSELEPLRKLGFSWPGVGEVSFEIEHLGAGWHMHCDILSARLAGVKPASFWSRLARLDVPAMRAGLPAGCSKNFSMVTPPSTGFQSIRMPKGEVGQVLTRP